MIIFSYFLERVGPHLYLTSGNFYKKKGMNMFLLDLFSCLYYFHNLSIINLSLIYPSIIRLEGCECVCNYLITTVH